MVARGYPLAVCLLLAVSGGYAVSAGLAALASDGLPSTTTRPSGETVVLASMLAFLIYLAVLIWAFAERQVARIVLVAAGITSWAGALGVARPKG